MQLATPETGIAEKEAFLRDRLRQMRVRRGWTQADVATKLHISRSAYTYYETGKTRPDIFMLAKISALYRVKVDSFLLK